MRRILVLLLVLAGFGGATASQGLSLALAAGPHASLLEIDDTIQPVSARFLSRGLDTAIEGGAQLLIIRLNTPGGLFSSTREMVETIMASRIPIVVFVSPPGARAASAGTFITVAAHIAAMSPGTNIGAASPVGGRGQDLPETLKEKATQDAAAFIRSIAAERGRNSQALEETVLNAVSYSAIEALEIDVIDIIASDVDDLLAQIDGRTVKLREGEVVLDTRGLGVSEIQQNPLEVFLNYVSDPNIAFVLLSLGTLGIFIEFVFPGLVVPGIAGAIALSLALVALGNLPVNWVGVALVAFSMALFFVEFQVPGIGVFGIAGAVSFVLGAFLLFGGLSAPPIQTPSIRINTWLIVGVSAAMFGFPMFVLRNMLASRSTGGTGITTPPTLVGETAVAVTALTPRGTVHVAGEDWSAESDSGEPIEEGEEVIVGEADGLTLKVFKASEIGE